MNSSLSLPFDPPSETRGRKKSGHVRATSVAVAQALREHLTGRSADVLALLHEFNGRHAADPTSAELAWFGANLNVPLIKPDWTSTVLYVRRGLSDLQAKRMVEAVPNGKRECAVTKRICETWRVRQR